MFALPPNFGAILRWTLRQWLVVTERSILVVISLLSWLFFQPSLEVTATLSADWIAALYIRNLLLMVAVAGGLHLYFYSRKTQGDALRYDKRDLSDQKKIFSFKNQLADNMFWTLASGVTIWTLYEVLMFWSMGNGYAPVLYWSDNPIWFILLFLLTPIWISFHFYWVHRWLHWPPLYRLAHALHHRNTNVGPWSGLSMHPVEHVIFFSSILIHFILPSSPVHILFHMQHQSLTAATSHTGYEAMLIKDKKHLALGTFHHQMHHRYFDCNYGNLEMPWDKWFGSFHDGTEESHDAFKQRRRALLAKSTR
ncbi:MAG: sterol desaturase family protein [Alphaproteobacteria bacterium]|nr:sterol desaturase family protein [Alphaproteobacteria bacterium]